MANYVITCDREGDISCAAVWQGRTLVDLYVDRISEPDMSGAIARGKVARVTSGGKVAWIDCCLSEKIYVESSTPLKSGAWVSARIQSTHGKAQGKAWRGAIVKGEDDDNKYGLRCPPPRPWQRALADIKKDQGAELCFSQKDEYALFEKMPKRPGISGDYTCNDEFLPLLEEIVEGLLASRVPLLGGSELVIERTEALIAIDVNAGESLNPTSVNLAAVREAARQIRLRNLSGIVVIDCLKMKDRADHSKVINAFGRMAQTDPASVSVFGLSRLGLLECTRARRGPALADVVQEE